MRQIALAALAALASLAAIAFSATSHAQSKPFPGHAIKLIVPFTPGGNADVEKEADRVYEMLEEHGIEVLYDDRDVHSG